MEKRPVTGIIMATMLEAKPFVRGLDLELRYLLKFVSDTPAHTQDGAIISNLRSCRESFFQSVKNKLLHINRVI